MQLHSKFKFAVEGEEPQAKPKTTTKRKAAKKESVKEEG
jgi:hypothetical protein